MESNFHRCMDFVFAREGGFVNDPADPGGATNLGITIATLRAWRGHAVSVDDVRHLGRAEAARIYQSWYWHPAWCGDLPAGVDLLVFDAAVNMGIEPSLNMLRGEIGVGLPPRSRRHAARRVDPHLAEWRERTVLNGLAGLCAPAVIAGLCGRRTQLYRGLATFRTFGAGWLTRVRLARDRAMHMWVVGDTGIP
jgi:lysozyme family protein